MASLDGLENDSGNSFEKESKVTSAMTVFFKQHNYFERVKVLYTQESLEFWLKNPSCYFITAFYETPSSVQGGEEF